MSHAGAPIHVVIPTHTTRHLDLVLVGLARQTRRPDSVTVSCDTDDPDIGGLIERWAPRLRLPVTWLRRARHDDGERLCQIRNNAVRHLVESLETTGDESGSTATPPTPTPAPARVLILDGDMVASDTCVERHAALGAATPAPDLILPYRVNIDEATTRGLSAPKLLSGEHRLMASGHQLAALLERDRRARKHILLRRLRLGDLHKPKLLGGHFSCTLDLYLRLNGFDELYQGWGFKDDEFAFRAARLGARVRPAAADIIAFHLYHPTRQPDAPMATLPTAKRFALRRSLPTIAEHGIHNPLDQPEILATRFGA